MQTEFNLRPLNIDLPHGYQPIGLSIGFGSGGLEVVFVQTNQKPTVVDLRRIWNTRLAGRAVPLLVAVYYQRQAGLCGPSGRAPEAYLDLDPLQVERLCAAALNEPNRHAALRLLQEVLPEVASPIPGIRNEGLLAMHELAVGVPQRHDWAASTKSAKGVMTLHGRHLLNALGFEIIHTDGPVSILAARGTKVAIALLLDRDEAPDLASHRFSGRSPVAYAMARADQERLPYVMVNSEGYLRLYPVQAGVGVGQRGRSDTYIQLYLDLLASSQAGYLWLLFSADALLPGGSLETILDASHDYAADLSNRLRERIYNDTVPAFATALAAARGIASPTPQQLKDTYQMALMILFRLLFIAYAEDKGLLPYKTNERYRARSLKQKAHELIALVGPDGGLRQGVDLSPEPAYWNEVRQLCQAVDKGKEIWGVPQYNGGLFSPDPGVSRIGAALEQVTLGDNVFVAPLIRLLVDQIADGQIGPVDFRSLGVREFGTIYEGLLESELSLAQSDLGLDDNGVYVPVSGTERAVVQAGEVYLHNASGARRTTGAFYTKSFAVEHLLDQALEPALTEHLARLDQLDDRAAADAFFDFRIADTSMGSGHFLVAGIDRIERRLSSYLSLRPLPGVIEELARLRARAAAALNAMGENVDVDDEQLLRRQIARRCIYGVDLNPMSVALARLSIWIHTFVPGLPLSLLDYNLVEGNSLVGVATLDEVSELLGLTTAGSRPLQFTIFSGSAQTLLERARGALNRLSLLADADAAEIRQARQAFEEARAALRPTEMLFDILAASRVDKRIQAQINMGAAQRWAEAPEALLDHEATGWAREIFGDLRPFHFPIVFPQVFLRSRPGFNVILGNPPWEEVVLDENSFWARYSPGLLGLNPREQDAVKRKLRAERPDLVAEYQQALQGAEKIRSLLVAGPFPGIGTGDPDLYKAFVWRFWHLAANPGGHLGVVLPRSVFSSKGTQPFRETLLREGIVADITFLLNTGGWVFDDAEPRYTIALFAAVRAGEGEGRMLPLRGPYSNLAHFIRGVQTPPSRFPVEEVAGWNESLAFPLLPSDDSLEVFSRLRQSPSLGAMIAGSWRARPYAELHATNDKPRMSLSKDCPPGFWPVYKGESFYIWQPDTGTYYAWGDPQLLSGYLHDRRVHAGRNPKSPFNEFSPGWINAPATLPCNWARLAIRDVTRATDTRTMIAALIPPNVFTVNTAPTVLFPHGGWYETAYLLGILCSIPLDWYARRFVEIHMNYHIFNALPIPRLPRGHPLADRIVALTGRLASPDQRFDGFARELGVECGPLTAEEKDSMIYELDAVVALTYGLNPNHLAHIFKTFHEGWDASGRLAAVLDHYHYWRRVIA